MQVFHKFLLFFYEHTKILLTSFPLLYHEEGSQKSMNKHMHNYIHKLRKDNPIH